MDATLKQQRPALPREKLLLKPLAVNFVESCCNKLQQRIHPCGSANLKQNKPQAPRCGSTRFAADGVRADSLETLITKL